MAKVATGQQMRSAERLLSVLASFTRHNKSRSIAEISKELDLSAATVRRLLITLEAHGFLTHEPDRGHYTLGHEVIRLASVALRGSSLVTLAAPYLDALNDALNETIQLTIRDGADLIVIDTRASTHTVKAFHSVGHRYPSYKGGAAGQALLAKMTDGDLADLLPDDEDWPETTPTAPSSLAALQPLLQATRAAGYATNEGLTGTGVWAVAAAITDINGAGLAAVNIPCPLVRVAEPARRELIIEHLLDQSRKLQEAAVFLQ